MANKGVTVNTVSPGYIGTEMVRAIRQDVLDKIVATIPVKRLGMPEIASMVSWVASEERWFYHGRRLLCQRWFCTWADWLKAMHSERMLQGLFVLVGVG